MEERNDTMDLDFENRLRTLILSNGLPGQSPPVNPDDSDTTKPALTGYLPPHLLTASRTEQQEYITKHKGNEAVSTPTLPKTRKKLTQAERKRGVSNLLDLSKPAPEVEGTISQALAQPYSTQDSNVNGTSTSSPQATSSAVPPHLSCFSAGSPASSTRVAPSIDCKQSRMPPQSSAGFVHSPAGPSDSLQGRANPAAGRKNFASGPSHSQSRLNHQPENGPHYTGHHRTFSAQPSGSYRAPLNVHSPHQPPRNFPPRNSGNYISPPNFFPRPNGQFPLTRPPPPPNRQLFNPNPQQYHRSDPQDIPVPGHMQVEYLEQVAAVEIAKAEITPEELQKKEEFRLELHNVCQWAVAAYEQNKDTSFDARTVALKCFGSLSSGFATHGSDMDLVLVSPKSSPDAASPDSEIPRLLEKVLLNEGYGARLLTRTRVPIIRLCEKPTADLKQALLEERAKWEADRDLAAAQKPEKKQKRKATATAKAKKAKSDGKPPEETTPTTPKADPDTGDAALSPSESLSLNSEENEDDHLLEEGDTPLSIHAQELERQADSTGQPDNAMQAIENTGEEHNRGVSNQTHVQAQSSATEFEESDQTTLIDEFDKATEDDNYSPPDIPQLDGGEARPVRKLKQALQEAPGDKTTAERPKPPQPVRTDAELVQLYMLAIGEGWFDDAERKIIFRFVNTVKTPNDSKATQELEEARTALRTLPDVLSRYREKPQDKHLDFPKEGVGIQCDINFSNHLALHNTQLLRCYSHCDPRVRPMVLFIKAWTRKRKINSPYHGTLSSYGYVLMVLHYLINIAAPPVVPNLQLAWQTPPKGSVEEDRYNGCDVRFWRVEKEIRLAAHRGMLTQNRQPLGFLLRGFFQYYAQEGRGVPCGGFSWSRSVISIRTDGGLLSKQEKGWVEARTEIIEPVIAGQKPKEIRHRYLLAIEDPFELEHNVARPVAHHGICAIRDEFRRANRLTQNAGFILGAKVDLFEEGQEHVQERLFFGPNPARLTRPRRFGPQNPVTPNGKAEEQQGNTNAAGSKSSPQMVGGIPAVAAKVGMPNGKTSRRGEREQATRADESSLGVVSDAGVSEGGERVAGDYEEVADNGCEVAYVPGSPQSLKEDMRG